MSGGSVSQAALLALHERLVARDPVASEEAARILLDPLLGVTERLYRDLDDQMVADAVVDALLDYFEEPSRADDGERVDPWGFLKSAAWRNAANLHRGRKRRNAREHKWMQDTVDDDVEHGSALGRLIGEETQDHRKGRVDELMRLLPDEGDRAMLRLRLDGERSTSAFAKVLGVLDLPLSQQRRLVKQAKDRIDKVIRRRRGRQT